MRKTLLLTLALAVSATAAQAQPYAPDLGNAGVYNNPPGYGAYDGKVSGFSPMIADGLYNFWCVDLNNPVPSISSSTSTPTDQYFATAFTGNSTAKKGNGDFSKTRQASQTKYLQAAWLIEKYEAGGNTAAWTGQNVQFTIWKLMGATNSQLGTYTDLSSQIASNYASSLTRDWFVLSDDNAQQSGNCTWDYYNRCWRCQTETSNQEYLMSTGRPSGLNVVPEPSTYALMTAGLLGMGLVARRRRKASV